LVELGEAGGTGRIPEPLAGKKRILDAFPVSSRIAMLTINTLLNEIKDVPVSRLEELYQLIQALTPRATSSEANRQQILSFAGAFSDMSEQEYAAYTAQTRQLRTSLFDRNIEI
jgi:hypothetical protein